MLVKRPTNMRRDLPKVAIIISWVDLVVVVLSSDEIKGLQLFRGYILVDPDRLTNLNRM